MTVKLDSVVTNHTGERTGHSTAIRIAVRATVPQKVLAFPPKINVKGISMRWTKSSRWGARYYLSARIIPHDNVAPINEESVIYITEPRLS